jgi:N-acetylglucosamine kinase-like BadF-type ATPase
VILLAVDGGNSKTDLALLGGDGAVLGFARGPLSSPHHIGLVGCAEVLQALVDQVGLDGRCAELAQILLAGIDFPEEEQEALGALSARGWAVRTEVANDTFAVLRAGTDRGWGVAITCGAGINCVGVSPDGRRVRFPALGAITGDWGGGYDVGVAALSAAARSADGRGPKTALERLVPEHFGLDSPTDVARAIHRGELGERRAVELAPVVLAAADDDPVAASIEQRLGDEVVALARAALSQLGELESPVDVVVGGGLMRAARPRLLARIESGLRDAPVAATLRRTSVPLIVGASLLALDQVAAGDDAHVRARDELVAAVTTHEEAVVR